MRYLVLVAALLLGAGGYAVYWFYVASAIPPAIAEWAEQRRAEGYEVAYADLAVEGFPFRLLVRARGIAIGRPAGPDPWRWRGESLAAVAQPWNFHHLIFSFEGRHELSYALGGEERIVAAMAEVPLVSVVSDGEGRLERFAVDLEGLELSASHWRRPLRARRLQLHGRINAGASEDHPAGSLDLALSAEDLALPAEAGGPLGTEIAEIEVAITVLGVLPRGTPPESVAAWRDDGGTVELRSFVLAWGPLDVAVSGTLALDEKMRPTGTATALVKGYSQTIDALVAGGWIGAARALTAKTVLALLAKEEAEGKAVRLPLKARGGRLYLGPLPLVRLPPLLPPPSKYSG